MPENIFSGTKLYNPLHFRGSEVKQKIHMFNSSRRLISKTTAATPPGELILLKFCQNVPNRQKPKVTKFGDAGLSRSTVMINNLMVWAKKP